MGDTLVRLFQQSAKQYPDNLCLLQKKKGGYRTITYRETWEAVKEIICGLLSMGVQKGDTIGLILESGIEWALIDLAILHIGAINVAIYTTLPSDQIQHILSDSDARYIFIQDMKHCKKLRELDIFGRNSKVIVMEPSADEDNRETGFDAFKQNGHAIGIDDDAINRMWMNIDPHDTAGIIYTSGTTGKQKGAVLSHSNFVSNIRSCKDVLAFKPGEIMLSVLPLSHVFGRLAEHYLVLSCGAAEVCVTNPLTLRETIRETSPHYMCVVPRVLEAFKEGFLDAAEREDRIKKQIVKYAISVRRDSRPALWGILNRTIFRKIRKKMGLERLVFFISGGAALKKGTAEFFYNLGIKVIEGYGMTETSPVISVNRPDRVRFGTVGQPLKDVEVKIGEDGEIIVRGPNVMQGYYKKPEETSEAIDRDGWFHTGDIGEIDGDGFIRITDRKKDIIVLGTGQKIAPRPIERQLKESSYILEAVLFCDEEGRISVVIVPDFKNLKMWVTTEAIGCNSEDPRELTRNEHVVKHIRNEIYRFTDVFTGYAPLHQVHIADREFSVETGELTPTLKARRHVIESRLNQETGRLK